MKEYSDYEAEKLEKAQADFMNKIYAKIAKKIGRNLTNQEKKKVEYELDYGKYEGFFDKSDKDVDIDRFVNQQTIIRESYFNY